MWKTKIQAKFEFKLQDMWIGCYWKKDYSTEINHAWVCLIPCVPLHIWWERVWEGSIDDIPF